MDFVHCIKMHIIVPVAVLLLVLVDGSPAAADPEISVGEHTDTAGDICNEHQRLHRRLDVVEEHVEKTVDHLYSEVNSLLDTLSGASWALPVASGPSVLDIFEEAKYLLPIGTMSSQEFGKHCPNHSHRAGGTGKFRTTQAAPMSLQICP
ncbi:placenta-specific protein 9 [Pelodytes ibericus]